MKRSLFTLVLTALLVAAAPAAEFPAAWQYLQTLRFEQTGLLRVDLPAETIDAAGPNQHDVRLFDDDGREVPFVIERMPANRPVPDPVAKFQATLTADATVILLTTGTTQRLASVTLETPAPEFLKPVTIEGSADGRAWTRLAAGEPVFRQFGASRLRLPLDDRAWAQLRLTLDNRQSPPIPITGAHLLAVPAVRIPERPIGVEIVSREEAGQQTRLTLRLSVASATLTSLKLQTSEPLFTRNASLVLRRVNENEIVETVLARDTIFRLSGNDAGANAEDVTFDTSVVIPTREVILAIDNGDSPPLPVTGLTGGGYPVVATFHTGARHRFHVLSGNARATPPRYDLAAIHGELKPVHVKPQEAGPLAANPAWREPVVLPGVELAGTGIDLAKWHYRKPIVLPAAGVHQLELDLEVLAHATPAFADLRLVRGGKQLPYLLDRTPRQRSFAPVTTRADDPKQPSTSRWDVQLPQAGLPLTRLECASAAALFQRGATLTEERRDDRGNTTRVRLGAVEWVRAPGRPHARLAIQFLQPPRTDRVQLEVENGDNPAIELSDFMCWHPATGLLFKADAGPETFLYYGNSAASVAQYDLQLVARELLMADKLKATLGAETMLKPVRGGGPAGPAGAGNWVFWTVLGVVVIALLIVLAKLLPKPPED